VTDRFPDGRRSHLGNSSECYKMGNYRQISMKFGTQTKTDMLSSKITNAKMLANWQDGCRRHFGNSSECYKMSKL
jgi:hypothetical protein